MFRVFINELSPRENESVTLSREESHHLASVLRATKGAAVILFNRKNQAWEAQLEDVHSKHTSVHVHKEIERLSPVAEVHLVQALPKGKTMDDVLRKGTEIGVTHFYPVITEHSEVRLDGERAQKKIDRWDSIAIEACKQSGNVCVPTCHSIQTLQDFFETYQTQPNDCLCVASLEAEARLLDQVFSKKTFSQASRIFWFIGPEGDFSASEYQLMKVNGVKSVRLSRNVLRVETAAIYALSLGDFWMKKE